MHNTDLRLSSERKRVNGLTNPVRRWAALLLVLLALAASFLIFTRDVNWEGRNRVGRMHGDTAYRNGNYESARAHYEAALANNPFDWKTHLSLANILFHKLNDQSGALRHYLFAVAYSPEPEVVEEARELIQLLRLMRAGELENPYVAIAEMFLAVETGAADVFQRRLSIGLRDDTAVYWEAWRKRGSGSVTGMRLTSGRDGFYDAALELEFPDATSMLLHMRCPLRDIWRIDLSFP